MSVSEDGKPIGYGRFLCNTILPSVLFLVIGMYLGLITQWGGKVASPCPGIDSTMVQVRWSARFSDSMNEATNKVWQMLAQQKKDSAFWYAGKMTAYYELEISKPW